MLHDVAYEVSLEKALEMYTLVAKSQHKSKHMAVMKFMNGTRTTGKYWSLWGENVNDAECFQRKLAGKLAVDLLE